MADRLHLNIIGTRGIPAAHGGFETFAEELALFLVGQGYGVTVYCQGGEGGRRRRHVDHWRGIERVHISTRLKGSLATMEFDLACIRDVLRRPGVDLVLGYNTAVFCLLQKIRRRQISINMDGLEWARSKWSLPARLWLRLNEYAACKLADLPIADHPAIAEHVAPKCRNRPVTIPYGSAILEDAPKEPIHALDLKPGGYFLSVSRIEPENSVLELVGAHRVAATGRKLVVLGRMDPDNTYHRAVRLAAGPDTVFTGAIYETAIVQALRFHARAYLHGHQVGGTNPSLVEALGAGNAVLAHDNRFNRWTAGNGQFFFSDVGQATELLQRLSVDDLAVQRARLAARERHAMAFAWTGVLERYRDLLLDPVGVQIAAE